MSVWGSCNAGLLVRVTFLKFKNDVRVLFLMLLFRLELCCYFLNLDGYLSIISEWSCIERRLFLFKKILDGRASDYLSEKLLSLKHRKSYDTRSRLSYRLSFARTNSMKRMFFQNAVKLWNSVSDNNFACFSDAKKFKRNYFDLIMCKFTPDSFKIDRIF